MGRAVRGQIEGLSIKTARISSSTVLDNLLCVLCSPSPEQTITTISSDKMRILSQGIKQICRECRVQGEIRGEVDTINLTI